MIVALQHIHVHCLIVSMRRDAQLIVGDTPRLSLPAGVGIAHRLRRWAAAAAAVAGACAVSAQQPNHCARE